MPRPHALTLLVPLAAACLLQAAASPSPLPPPPEAGLRVPEGEVLDLGPAFRGAHQGVLGLDGAFSIPLSPGRSLWVFGDTLLGGWHAGGDRRLGAMPPNTAAQVSDADWITGFTHARFVGPRLPIPVLEQGDNDPADRLWPLDLVPGEGGPWLGYVAIRPHGTGPFDFTVRRVGLAARRPGPGVRFTPRLVLGGAHTPLWGSSALPEGQWLYLYAGGTPTRLARLPRRLTGAPAALEVWTGRDWSRDTAAAAALPDSGPELSVRWNAHLKAYMMVYTPVFGRSIEARLAPAPTGPWGPARTLLALGAPGDREALFYGAKQHQELDADGGRTVVLSYNTNAPSARLAARPDLYWPHLVRVTFPRTP